MEWTEDSTPLTDPRSSNPCRERCPVCACAEEAQEKRPAETHVAQGRFMAVTGASMTCANGRTPLGVSPR